MFEELDTAVQLRAKISKDKKALENMVESAILIANSEFKTSTNVVLSIAQADIVSPILETKGFQVTLLEKSGGSCTFWYLINWGE